MKNTKENADSYTVQDICTILAISKPTAYKWIINTPFKVVKVGRKYRIPKDEFDKWFYGDA
jgi:excisionase family DNA binding protein